MDVKKDSLKAWILAARPKTLTGAAVPVMIGLALAWKDAKLYEGDVFSWVAAMLCLLFGVWDRKEPVRKGGSVSTA